MSGEQARLADTKSWLALAGQDLHAAEHDLSGGATLHWDVLFHCQQATEKAWKAFLTWHDVPFRKTHELEILGGQCAAVDPSLEDLASRARHLTRYAWKLRYPGERHEPESEEVSEALALAREAVGAVAMRLPEEARP